MVKFECICEKCKKNIPAWQGGGGQIVPGGIVVDFLNKKIIFICPECGFKNELNLGSIDLAVKKSKSLPRITNSRF